MIERSELQVLKKRIEEPRRFIQVVMGPRQVGKTTMVVQLYNQLALPSSFLSADAVPTTNVTWLEQVWDAVRIKIKSQSLNEYLLIIDEIQKILDRKSVV